MFTRFEEYAASQMLGHADSPPRSQGKLFFAEAWQRQLFGLTLAVAKRGHFDWEDFRQHLIESIGDWERLDCAAQPPWDYYERFFRALLQVLEQQQVVTNGELAGVLADRPVRSSE
ncbi:nitrile hydratase accessory protein [Variovorax sp. OV084]|jgi:nitrile hydratase accessory protein|uniref:nitrile hydratase accessory protein n=1 Tax=Variovorax sp. OV084 TaxID=1882777 RepID=UPI0008AC262C|nr:nitrile hydratase accessory protein [Variovorax sp. OV084]SEU19985.1 nitrile hydratase accessory protein [Variovorax sp. OV084]